MPLFRFILLVISGLTVSAQTAALTGHVTDETGAVIPNARVTLSADHGQSATASTSTDGSYTFAGLPPGAYSLNASAPDMALAEPLRTVLKPGPQTIDLQLRVVLASQQVGVQESAMSTDPATNASATVLKGRELEALADDPTDLAEDLQALAGPAAGPNGGQIFVDGFSGGQIPSKDSIREVRINQNPFSPEYDKLGLGRIEILTRPGSDRYRGTLFDNFGTDFWNSRNPYAAEKAPFLLREYGGSVGGPFGKATSFFADLRRDATDNGSIINAVTVDPSTFTIAPFTGVFRVRQRAFRVSPRVDHQINPNHTLTLRYAYSRMDVPGAGIGGFNLAGRGYDVLTTTETLQATETAVLGAHAVNEIRFQYFRIRSEDLPFDQGPAVQVLGSFYGGGATVGRASDLQNNYEFQDYVSLSKGAHTWRFGARVRRQDDANVSPANFGGTFTFSGGSGLTSIEQYRRTLYYQSLGYPADQIRALGGGASQFTIASGTPGLTLSQADVSGFVGDDWKVRPKLSLSLGLRYETQTNIHDWTNFAPRAGISWAAAPKTVVRVGFGIFYDRFPLTNTLTANRYNGIVQQQYVIANPDFFPSVPSIDSLQGLATTSIVQEVSASLRAPRILQSAVVLERQLPRDTTIALTYANSHGLHMLRSRDINAPLPGTAVFPYGSPGPIFLMESAGLYNQNQFVVNVNTKASKHLSMFGSYMLNRALSNTDGVNTFPANQYDLTGEYGPAATDVRHRANLGGALELKWNVRISPFIVLESGPPFDITTGQDLYGTTLFNARPAFATGPAKPGVIDTPYGFLDPNPVPGERIVPRNFGRGPGAILINTRIAKTIAFGPVKDSAARYNLIISMAIRNLINHTNPGPIIGNLTSPLFGQANQPAGSRDLGGGGFSEAANNRRLELQIRFAF